MQNNPTLSFDANEPLYNADFDELANATNFTRVFVGRMSNTTTRMMGFEDNRLGYGFYYYSNYDRVYAKHHIQTTGNYSTGAVGKGISAEAPFIFTQFLDTNERNYTNASKAYFEVNGTGYTYGSLTSAASPKDSIGNDSGVTSGMLIGTYFANPASYYWRGNISEIIYFDDVLREPEKEALNEWLNRKYGKTTTCTLPADTTGYNVDNCNVGAHAYDNALTEGECSVSCAAGYDFSRTHLPKATCSAAGEKFVLSGCYPTYDGTRDPPTFVTNDNVGHWDTYYGVTLDSSGNVQEWSSYPNKDGDHTRLISVNSTGATLTQNNIFFAERPTVTFNGGTHLVSNNYFNYMDNASEHTKIVKAKAATNNEAPVAGDNSAGYEAWIKW